MKATVESNVELKWETVENANNYKVVVYNYIDKTSKSYVVYENSKLLSNLPSNTFRWNVKACNDSGCSEENARMFSIKEKEEEPPPQAQTEIPSIPTLISAEKINSNSVEFKWETVGNANEYKIILYDYISKRFQSQTSYTNSNIISNLKGGPFKWSVKACNDSGCSDENYKLLSAIN